MVADDPESSADLDGHATENDDISTLKPGQCNATACRVMPPDPMNGPPINQYPPTSQTNSASQFTKDEAIGMAKGTANAVLDFTNWIDSGINALLGTNLHTDEFVAATPGEKSAMLGTSLALVFVPGPGEEKAALKAANLPAWKTIAIDMDHILSGHTEGGTRAMSGLKDLFPRNMSEKQIENAIRQAYRTSSKIGGIKGGRVLLQGKGGGLKIQMYLDIAGKIIRTAWPK